MRIAFLTDHLEPGKGGIGDYTRLLAEESARQGHSCMLLSLCDAFVPGVREQPAGEGARGIPVIRQSPRIPWEKRIDLARERLARFKPEWLSLQFSFYGFSPLGIVRQATKQLRGLMNGYPLHVMIHELWLSAFMPLWPDSLRRPKRKLLGEVQRYFVLRMLQELSPRRTHTSNPTFVAVLKHFGIEADHLPLFGNIPVGDRNADSWLFPILRNGGIDISPDNRDRFLLFGLFGAIHPVWPPEPLFRHIQELCGRMGRTAVVVSFGRMGAGKALWERLRRDYASQFTFVAFGEQRPDTISQLIHSMDFGIATSPYELMGKSGSATAMLEHGLPVVVNRDDVRWSHAAASPDRPEPLLIKMDSRLPSRLLEVSKSASRPRLKGVATLFLEALGGRPSPSESAQNSRYCNGK